MMELKDFFKPLWTSITAGKKIKGGVSSEPAEYTVIVTAADKEDVKGFGLFKLTIRDE